MRHNEGEVLTVQRTDRLKLNTQKGIPPAGICSLSIFFLPFPFCFCPPPPPPPTSSHHSKMLPVPALVVMVTKTRGILTWLDLPGCWLVRFTDVRREGWGGGRWCHRPTGSLMGGNLSQHTHRHNRCLFKVELSGSGAITQSRTILLTDVQNHFSNVWLLELRCSAWLLLWLSCPRHWLLSSAMALLPLKCAQAL